MKPHSGWTKLYFTDRSPKDALSPNGVLTTKGLCLILMDLSVEGNYGPICKKDLTLYSNSAKGFTGRYYILSKEDENILLIAVSDGLLEICPKGDHGAYVDFTETGLQEALKWPPPQLAFILSETQDAFLKVASRSVGAVCELVKGFETNLIRARSFNASYFTFQTVVSILHKMMLDSKTAMEHLTRQHKQIIRQKPIENNCSLFDLYVGQNARVLNSFEQGMFMSVQRADSEYRLGKWHGGYNHLDDYNPLNYGRRSLARGDWLDLKIFEVYGDDYTLGTLLDVLRNNEVSHSSLSKRKSLKRMLEIANRNLRGDGDVGQDDSRGIHETLVYIGYNVGKFLRIIRCWRATL